ncbi:Transposase IS4 family protein (plasmid) [Deinococcus gobiensis I-0]|uniref:Transposase IS4 family protein n=1 Tax=Deinococcus gobiensis (strain DSM 21396 / JCM 16679 / CGMCC 1.7299 / I-0) TaxID=745776 RepID=H8H1E5_DEIGI|nr:Transposase IS4 family protein [Deinococcus gobiensis I-0]
MRWRPDRHPRLRKRIETVFAGLMEAQIRSVQTKTLRSLRLHVVLAVFFYSPKRRSSDTRSIRIFSKSSIFLTRPSPEAQA